jgi:hypothetical protein
MSTLSAAAPPPVTERPVPSRPTAWEPRGLLARPLTAIVVLQAVWLWWAYAQGWFLQADLSNLREGADQRPGWGYLTGQLGGHFAPVARFVYWVFNQLSPLDYGLAVALRVGCQAVSTVLLFRLLTRLVDSHLVVVAVVVLYAVNPLLLGGTSMFTPGITIGIGQVFTLLALAAHVRREQTGELRWAVGAGLALGVAVLCSEGWVVAALAFPVLSAVHFYPGSLAQRLMRLIRGWRTWVLLVAPVVVAGVGVLAYAQPVGAATPSLSAAYRLLRNSWLYSIGPSWIGGPLHWYADSTSYIATASASDLVVLLGQLGVAVTVLVGVRRNGPASLAGWLLPLGVWILSMLLVGYRGYSQLQDLIAVTPRYLAALVPFFAIGAALALAPDGVARTSATYPTPGHRAARTPDRSVLVPGAVVVAVAVTSLVSGARFAHIFGSTPAHRYVDNLSSSARLAGPQANVYDTAVPPWLISPIEPHHRVTDLLRLSDVAVKVQDPSSTPLIAGADGRLVRSVFVPAGLVVPAPPCGTAVHGAGTFTYPLNRPVPAAEWYLHLQLYQRAPSTITVQLVDATGAVAPVGGGTLHLSQLESISLRLPRFAPTAIRFTSTDRSTALCMTAVQVGAPFPAAGS